MLEEFGPRLYSADGPAVSFYGFPYPTRMARAFDRWRKFDAGRQQHAHAALERIRDARGLTTDVAEIVSKALA